jgi:hypothetical protein
MFCPVLEFREENRTFTKVEEGNVELAHKSVAHYMGLIGLQVIFVIGHQYNCYGVNVL